MDEQQKQPDETRHIGRGMMIAAWAVGLGLLSLLFSGVLERQRNPNMQIATTQGTNGASEIRLQRNRYGHYHATGAINDQPVEFMLDTGASDVAIPAELAQRLGLPRGIARQYETANGTIQAYTTTLDSLSLGEISLQRVRASINPSMDGNTILLGMSALKQLEFTQRGDTLIIRQYQ